MHAISSLIRIIETWLQSLITDVIWVMTTGFPLCLIQVPRECAGCLLVCSQEDPLFLD